MKINNRNKAKEKTKTTATIITITISNNNIILKTIACKKHTINIVCVINK